MQAEDLRQLIRDITSQRTEKQTIELKSANKGCPTRLYDTLSSFSNQDAGGIIIFGIDETKNFEVVGVYDPHDLQKKVAEQCKQMEPRVLALFTMCELDGKMVVSAEIPGVDLAYRPVYYKGVGRIKGSYVRLGDSDELMNEYEIYSYEAFRKRTHDEVRVVPHSKLSLLDQEKINSYINAVKKERHNLAENVSDHDILELMGIVDSDVPTLAGNLVFSKYPQAYFPQLCITAVVLPGTEIGDLGDDGERFIDNERITGTIPQMLESAVDFVRRNLRTKTIIDEDGIRRDKVEYPMIAVREAILNAIVHRDYSVYTENTPIRIEMYRDHMDIINDGGLYGSITIDQLGKVRPETRNPVLANILEILKITENRYSGIPTIRKEFQKANLPAPIFTVRHGEFKVTFKNNIYKEEIIVKSNDTKKDILRFCQVPRTRGELIEFTGLSRYYTMSSIVQPLLDNGDLVLTIPDKPKSSKQKYVINNKR